MVILRLENGMEVLGLNKKTIISKKKISGLSILEAIVSTAIIGIGFVAILQMTNYSVQSIQVSSERTKANYLTNMIAEDVLVNLRLSDDQGKNFSQILAEGSGFKSSYCENPANAAESSFAGNVYGDSNDESTTFKQNKWKAILNSKAYLSCKGSDETRNFQVFKICSSSGNCNLKNDQTDEDNRLYVNDQHMYIGRIQMNLNDGNKIKYLYFQTDYKIKE